MMTGENPEREYQGELCDKIFPNGRVLGGHVSRPVAKNIVEGEPPLAIDDGGLEEAGRPGYLLRVNPKKSWKFLGLMENSQENPCPVCNKRFGSMNALCGHMKIHSGKDDGSGDRYRGKRSGSMKSSRNSARLIHDGKRLSLSLSSEDRYVGWSKTKGDLLLSVLLDDEAMHVTRRKRTPRISCDVDERTEGVLCSAPNGFSFSSEAEEDPVYKAAVLLMILSKGEAGFNSSGLGIEPFQKRSAPDFFDMEKLGITEASEYNESHSRGYTRMKRKGVKLAVPARMLCGDREAVHKKPKAAIPGEEPMYEAAMMDCDMMGIVGSNSRERPELWLELGLNSFRDRIRTEESHVFRELGEENKYKSRDAESYKQHGPVGDSLGIEGNRGCAELKGTKDYSEKANRHVCSICHKEFSTGQALGGHKRAHYAKNPEANAEMPTSAATQQRLTDITNMVDP